MNSQRPNTETVKAGKVTLHRTQGGTVWFIDATGNKREILDPMNASRLFDAVTMGSGEVKYTTRTDATGSPGANLDREFMVGGEPWRHSYREEPLANPTPAQAATLLVSKREDA